MPEGSEFDGTDESLSGAAIRLATEIAQSYGLASLTPRLNSCQWLARADTLNVAVLGRFKAGKSSFLNHFLQVDLLPVGVIPVTSVVTEVGYGSLERAEVRYQDGRSEAISVNAIADFIDESRNPANCRKVALVSIDLPSLERFRGLRFVDTPGLESVLAHNTDAMRAWLPNVGLAVVAVGVDPPLSQRDVELIGELHRHTPNIRVLLTKIDMLDERGRAQVRDYVSAQLSHRWNGAIPIHPYSIRPEFESLRNEFERIVLATAGDRSRKERDCILIWKAASLLDECAAYFPVAIRSAESGDAEKALLKQKILGEKRSLEDSKLALRLIVRHAAASTRAQFEKVLEKHESQIAVALLRQFAGLFPGWTGSFKKAARAFADWIEPAMTAEIRRVSCEHTADFQEPLRRTGRQLSQSLQDFRNRIAEKTVEALGVPLRTTEVEIEPEIPAAPDIRIGKLFDREWELIWFLIPMPLVKGIVERHLRRKITDLTFTNLSRLASQWEGIVRASLGRMEEQAQHRLNDLVETMERVLDSERQAAPRIREDAARVESLRAMIRRQPQA